MAAVDPYNPFVFNSNTDPTTVFNLPPPGNLTTGSAFPAPAGTTQPANARPNYFPAVEPPTNTGPASVNPGTTWDSVLQNSARAQVPYNQGINFNIRQAYEEHYNRWLNSGQKGPAPEDPTPYLWSTDFDAIYNRGTQGSAGHGLDPKYANGPSYYQIGVPAGAYNAIDPEVAARTPGWDGLGVGPGWDYSNTPAPTSLLGRAAQGQNLLGPGMASTPGLTGNANPQAANLSWLNSLLPQQLMMGGTMAGGLPSQFGASGNVNQWLADLARMMGYGQQFAATGNMTGQTSPEKNPDIDYLRSLVQNPTPYNSTDLWQKMITAQDENTRKNAGNLQEYYNVTGNRFSSAFDQGLSDYWEQTNRDQNALLAQLQMQGYESERNRQYGGANSLANLVSGLKNDEQARALQASMGLMPYAFQGPAIQSSQNFNWALNDRNQQFQQWLQNSNQGFQAAMYNAGAADQSSQALLNNAMQAGNQLNQNAIFGANSLFGAENAALNNLFGSAVGSIPWWQQAEQWGAGMGLNTAGTLGGLLNANLSTGGQLGQQQYSTYQDQLNRSYQEWMRQQPWYHPFLSMLQPYSFNQSSVYMPQYTQSPLSQIAQMVGAIAAAMAGGG